MSAITILKHRFYPKELLILILGYLITEGIFSWLFLQNSLVIQLYQKVFSILIFAFMLWHFQELRRGEKLLILLFTILVIKLIFESLWLYDSIFKQFTLFTVIYPVVFTLFIRYALRRQNIDLLEFLSKFYLLIYIIFMIFFGRGLSFSLEPIDMEDYGPFSGDTRIIHARSVYMLILPMLWFLNEFFEKRKFQFLLGSLFCVLILIIHQHRSVWSCALLAVLFYGYFLFRSDNAVKKHLPGLFALCLAGILGAWFITAQLKPELLHHLSDRFNEILDPTTEGSTGNFRVEQMVIYGDYIKQKPVLGWSFEGFALPNPLVDWWDENTGHHFHQGFVEILFYHGFLGLSLKYGFLFYILFKAFSIRPSAALSVLMPFCISGLLFSLNYVLPLVFWGHTGMCLFYMDDNEENHDLYRNTGP